MKRTRFRRLCAIAPPGVLLVAAALAPGLAARAQQPARTWCVTAMDDDHKPVTGLGKEDFALKDGGARQPVVSVDPATGPIAIGLVFWATPPPRAAGAVSDDLVQSSPGSRVVMTSGVPATSGPSTFQNMIERTAAALAKAEGFERRVVIAVIAAPISGVQFGAPGGLIDVLSRSRTPLWTVELSPSAGARTSMDDALDPAVAAGGGMRWRVKTDEELADAAAHIAALLGTAQYFVTANLPAIYTPPAPIATRHDRGIVLVPLWPDETRAPAY